MSNCPCGLKKEYADCCEPIIKGRVKASTAEALMRARYSSYVKHEIDFIADSCVRDEGKNNIDLDETRKWSEESEWLGLTIHGTQKGGTSDTEGTVDFSAFYIRDGLKDEHRELAKFKKVNGEWFYADGSVTGTTVVRSGAKVGRNEPCPCGSGKKYKQCCGR